MEVGCNNKTKLNNIYIILKKLVQGHYKIYEKIRPTQFLAKSIGMFLWIKFRIHINLS